MFDLVALVKLLLRLGRIGSSGTRPMSHSSILYTAFVGREPFLPWVRLAAPSFK